MNYNENQIKEKILIIDYGSQLTELIARRIRELDVYSEIYSYSQIKSIKNFNKYKGIILSGGPATVTKKILPQYPRVYIKYEHTNIRYLFWVTAYSSEV